MASDTDEAIAIAEERKFDLVLTDLVLPGADGRELVRRLKRHRRELPVLYMSGYSISEAVGTAMGDLAPLLQKPFTPDDLLVRVRQVLDSSRSRGRRTP